MAGQNISHEGHRQRMRARVEQYGLESLAPHEALEYLLYITNARRDTNGIAHALLERFGSFAGVLEASEEELCRVPGPGQRPDAASPARGEPVLRAQPHQHRRCIDDY